MLEGIKKLIGDKMAEHDATKAALKFAKGFIDDKYLEFGPTTYMDYETFKEELAEIEKAVQP